ncbi:unnamed protein product [Clavelina lepadiformis]|uniref:HRDC domain-containing protein n=1 Tax=Clavelina lepadiformis TaxID=159417 RepID=A0ABP0FY37_CLALP
MDNEQEPFSSLENVDEFCKNALNAVMQVVRTSNALPSSGDDYEFYSSFTGFREFVSNQKKRLINNIDKLVKNQGLKANFSSGANVRTDTDDFTDSLIECNDGLLERVSALIDQCPTSRYDKKQKDAAKEAQAEKNFGKGSSSSQPSNTIVSSWNKRDKQGRNKTFKLLHAQNILRPQLKFKNKIDNTNTPFVPIIRSKPNAIVPLSKSLVDIRSGNVSGSGSSLAITSLLRQARQNKTEDISIYEHPYQHELTVWEPVMDQLENVEPIKYFPLDPESCMYIDDVSKLQNLLDDLKASKEFAVDLEHHSYRTFQGITCLMQISTRQQDYIVDTLALRSELSILNDVFTDPKIVKIFHGADSDVLWLQRDFGIYIVNMFDTGQASRVLDLERFSLNFLIRHYCDIDVDKKFQLADWRIRPLPKEMLYYAQADTHYLLYIYDMMRNNLLDAANGEKRLLYHVLCKSRDICLIRYEKPLITPDSHLLLLERHERRGRGKKNLHTPQQLEALRLLYQWRDSMARQEDESSGYVLPNHMLLQIAEILPREAQGVLACCNPIPPLVRQHVLAMHQLVVEAREKSYSVHDSSSNVQVQTKVPFSAKLNHEEHLLNCPHDLSHSPNIGTDVKFKEKSKLQSSGVSSIGKSALLGPFNTKKILSNGVNVFSDGPVKCVVGSTNKNTTVVKNVMENLKQFSWDPFHLFMPQTQDISKVSSVSESVSNVSGDTLTLKHMLSGNFVWKMRTLNMTAKSDDDMKDNDDDVPKTFGKVVDVPKEAQRDTDEQVQVLRQMIKAENSKKKEKRSRSFTAPAVTFAGLVQDKRIVEERSRYSPQGERGRSGFRGRMRGRGGGFARPQETNQKRPFVPYEYSNEDYKRFNKKGGMKKRRYK